MRWMKARKDGIFTKGKRAVFVAALLIASGCQASGYEGGTTPSPTSAIEPRVAAPSPTKTTEPPSMLQTSTPTVSLREPFPPTESTPVKSKEEGQPMKITIVYDNNPYDPRLRTAWGFAGLIETRETTILFDTGGDGSTLLSNMSILEIESKRIETVVLSHIHGDHTGGLASLLAMDSHPTVYVPRSFPANFKSRVRASTDLVEVHQALEITKGVLTTGEMGSGIIEQALVLSTSSGDEVYLALGGFHLGGASEGRIEEIISDFRQMGVQKVAPCHCTGDKAIALFGEAYGDDFIESGVGLVIEIPP